MFSSLQSGKLRISRNKASKRRRPFRPMKFEQLENRQLLSAIPFRFGFGGGAHFSSPPPSLSLSVHPDDIVELASAPALVGTVARTGSTMSAANITINIADPNSELVSDASISVTIPAGSASTTFTLPLANPDTTPDGTTSPVTLTATDNASVLPSATAKLEVIDPVVSVFIPPQVLESSTSTFTGYVSVNTPASLNTGGMTVSLAGSDSGAELTQVTLLN
jgi:hypothetical protein